ncbi:MAG: hypothetical protein K6F53_09785 [Lachnospiraceae bacterium]|nr:hypothetical protein [Lachnospiraceae bacterium]
MKGKEQSLFAGSAAFFLCTALRGFLPVSNVGFYVIACASFAIVSAIVFMLMNKGRADSKGKAGKEESDENGSGRSLPSWKIFGALSALCPVLWMIFAYMDEFNEPVPLNESAYLRHTMPLYLWLPLMAAGTALIIFFAKKAGSSAKTPSCPDEQGEKEGSGTPGKSFRIRKLLRLVVTLPFAAIVAAVTYAPNIFQDVQGGTYHSHAYTNSIIQVCWMIPYSKNMQTLYGHYALFYMPVLRAVHKFFGLDLLTGIFLFNAFVEFLTVILFAYVLDRIAKKEILFYAGLFAVGEYYFMLMQGGVYLQVHAHRVIFPTLLFALVLRERKEKKKGILHGILMTAVLTLAITWSTEVGAVLMVSYMAYLWYLRLAKAYGGFPAVSSVKTAGKQKEASGTEPRSADKTGLLTGILADGILHLILPFFLSYLIVLFYNRLCGAGLSLREYLFPIISDRDYIGNTELALPGAAHPYVFSSILLLCFLMPPLFRLAASLWENGKKKEPLGPGTEAPDISDREAFRFFLSLTGLGLLLYYVHRPTWGGMSILVFLVPILLVLFLELRLERRDADPGGAEGKKNRSLLCQMLVLSAAFILFMMSFDGLVSIPGSVKAAKNTVWKRQELLEFTQHIYNQVPPGCFAFGEGVPELMSLIDRDTMLHTTEWSYLNMPLDTMAYARENLAGRPWMFCNLYSLSYLQENYPGLTDEYDLHEEFEYNGAQFALFYHK